MQSFSKDVFQVLHLFLSTPDEKHGDEL